MKTKIYILFTLIFIMLVNSCSSVFSAGVSGKVVDAESTTNPKEGIADVEIYSYVKEKIVMQILIHTNLVQDFHLQMINISSVTLLLIPMELSH